MKKLILSISLVMIAFTIYSQKKVPSLRIKSYQRSYLSGVAPTNRIELGGKENVVNTMAQAPEYFIYLLKNKLPNLKIERVWIKQQLYLARIDKMPTLPVVIQEGKKKDTLVRFTDEMVWQIHIMGKDSSSIKPKKAIANQIKANELLLLLTDNWGHIYIQTSKQIQVLEAARGQ